MYAVGSGEAGHAAVALQTGYQVGARRYRSGSIRLIVLHQSQQAPGGVQRVACEACIVTEATIGILACDEGRSERICTLAREFEGDGLAGQEFCIDGRVSGDHAGKR